MTNKIFLVLIIITLPAGGVSAQAKNTITVDVGPLIVGLGFGAILSSFMEEAEGAESSGFGIGAQYEFNILNNLSAAARFAYLQFGMGLSMNETAEGITLNAKTGIDFSSYSIEGHVRYYIGNVFFLDGMIGFANLTIKMSGSAIVTTDDGQRESAEVSFSPSQGFLKFGGKIGWRIRFGDKKGFTFEPSFGYSYGIGITKSLGDQITEELGLDDGMGIVFDVLGPTIFIGGPRLSLAIGWSF